MKQRYCNTKRELVNTEDWRSCTHLKKEEVQMAKKNSKLANDNERAFVESFDESYNINEVEEISEDEINVEIPNDSESEYEIVLATPSYFIINKNGVNEVINEINTYKKGDIIKL